MLTRYLWGQINSACITSHKLTLTFGRRKGGWILVWILKHHGCKQKGFLTIPCVNHKSKMTNGALIQFMNYAVVMATFIKMHQSTEHFVYEIMIYHVWLFTANQAGLLLAVVHTMSKIFCLKVFTDWFIDVCLNKVLGHRTLLKRNCIRVSAPLPEGRLKYQQSNNNHAKFGHTISQAVCVVLAFAERERDWESVAPGLSLREQRHGCLQCVTSLDLFTSHTFIMIQYGL